LPFPGSLEEIQANIKSGDTSCLALVHSFLENIDRHKELNAFVEVYTDEAITEARRVDEKFAAGTQGRLAGLVIGLKDLIAYEGHELNASSKMLEGYKSLYSATAIKKLLAEDAIIIGRQNCDEFGMGSSNENSVHGITKNGFDPTKVPGGSSGGSAVAVQMAMCSVSLGTDTGGSVRQPAAFCGVIGLKPTYGRISRRGLVAYASSFDTIGIIANHLQDSEAVLAVIAGSDPLDSTTSSIEFKNSSAVNQDSFKICYFKEIINQLGTKEAEIFNHQLNLIKDSGHHLEAISFPFQDYLVPAYYLLTMAEASSNLSRYDGVRYGHRAATTTTYQQLFGQSRSEGFGEEVKRRILLGTFVLSSGYYDAYVTKAQKVRQQIREATEDILQNFDFIISPTTPTPAFEIGQARNNPTEMYLEDMFTVHASLAGLPAISLPIKEKINNLPLGIHLTAGKFEEHKLLKAGQLLEELNR
jgi:aspartyl-tRNA(Asn)/glutamyl-tRNA(Gln) amidotransferase subunit A